MGGQRAERPASFLKSSSPSSSAEKEDEEMEKFFGFLRSMKATRDYWRNETNESKRKKTSKEHKAVWRPSFEWEDFKEELDSKNLGESSGMLQRTMSVPATPGTPSTPVTPNTPPSARKDNVWRSVFNPGSNLATKTIGADKFDKPQPNSPTVYDWLYSGDTRSNHR